MATVGFVVFVIGSAVAVAAEFLSITQGERR